MSELISGKDALIELGNGRIIGYKKSHEHQIEWIGIEDNYLHISDFFGNDFIFYLKPKTFMLNGIEVPKPNKPESCYSSNGSVIIVMDDNDKAVELCMAIRKILTD